MRTFNLRNKKQEKLCLGQFSSFIIFIYLVALLISALFIKKETSYSVNTLALLFLLAMICFALSSYFQIKHSVYFNLSALKLVPHIELKECLQNIRRIALFEEFQKANGINFMILVISTVSHVNLYQNQHVNVFIFITTVAIQLFCFARLNTLKKYQVRLYFPEVKRAHNQVIAEQKLFADTEKPLPWYKRTF